VFQPAGQEAAGWSDTAFEDASWPDEAAVVARLEASAERRPLCSEEQAMLWSAESRLRESLDGACPQAGTDPMSVADLLRRVLVLRIGRIGERPVEAPQGQVPRPEPPPARPFRCSDVREERVEPGYVGSGALRSSTERALSPRGQGAAELLPRIESVDLTRASAPSGPEPADLVDVVRSGLTDIRPLDGQDPLLYGEAARRLLLLKLAGLAPRSVALTEGSARSRGRPHTDTASGTDQAARSAPSVAARSPLPLAPAGVPRVEALRVTEFRPATAVIPPPESGAAVLSPPSGSRTAAIPRDQIRPTHERALKDILATQEAEPTLGQEPSVAAPIRLPRGGLASGILAAGVVLILFVVYALYGTALLQGRAQRAMSPATHWRVAAADVGLDDLVSPSDSRADLAKGPGQAPGSGAPGGTTPLVLVGHRTTNGAPFRHIGALRPGGKIVVSRGSASFAYAVVNVAEMKPDATLYGSGGSQVLLLVSATPAYSGTSRLVVIARLLGPAAQVSPRTSIRLPALDGSPLDLFLAIACVGGLAVGWGMRSRFRTRLPRWIIFGAWLPAVVVTVLSWHFLLGSMSRVL
jgi:LPXTG-site transpeptidase (sortase) family protein